MAEAVSRMVSLSLRSAVDPKDVVKQLRGITDMPAWDQGQLIRSVPDAIALVLDDVIAADTELQPDDAGQLTMLEQPTAIVGTRHAVGAAGRRNVPSHNGDGRDAKPQGCARTASRHWPTKRAASSATPAASANAEADVGNNMKDRSLYYGDCLGKEMNRTKRSA